MLCLFSLYVRMTKGGWQPRVIQFPEEQRPPALVQLCSCGAQHLRGPGEGCGTHLHQASDELFWEFMTKSASPGELVLAEIFLVGSGHCGKSRDLLKLCITQEES